MIHNKQKDAEINKKDVENDDNQQIKKIKSKWKSTILIPNFPFPSFGKENKPFTVQTLLSNSMDSSPQKANQTHNRTNFRLLKLKRAKKPTNFTNPDPIHES